jgi:flagellin-like protein
MVPSPNEDRRGVSEVMGTVVLVSVVVILASIVSVFAFDLGVGPSSAAPQLSVTHELVDDGGERTIAVTLDAGEAVRTDRLYVIGSEPLDIGGPPGSGEATADETYASDREKFTESSGGDPPQVDIGETWESGETVYLDPVGSVEGVTVRIYWSSRPVRGINPGTVSGETSYEVATFTVAG